MKSFRYFTLVLLILTVSVVLIEARGGRGRGGSSFGGLFGGWRKYKKPSSGGSSRRIINGSPMHTSMTKPNTPAASPSLLSHSPKVTNSLPSYPRQQMPSSHGYRPAAGNYYTGQGAAHLPAGSSYYSNTAAIPQGAVYYAQAPRTSSTGDFLFGMWAGHSLSHMFFPRPYISHVYRNQPTADTAPASSQGTKIIIINNGEATNVTEISSSTNKTTNLLPPGNDVPLAPFDPNLTPEQTVQPALPAPQNIPENPPEYGIICMPLTLNETDPSDPSKQIPVERTVCFPAPPPPPAAEANNPETPKNDDDCIHGYSAEIDSSDPLKYLDSKRTKCSDSDSTPKEIVGEIQEVTEKTER